MDTAIPPGELVVVGRGLRLKFWLLVVPKLLGVVVVTVGVVVGVMVEVKVGVIVEVVVGVTVDCL